MILSLGLSGCAFDSPSLIPIQKPVEVQTGTQSTAFQKWNKKFEIWENKQKTHLLPHQKYPIFYLETHPKQLGLVINQGLGTGKTFLAIGFAERHQNHAVVILGPKFLHSHWLEHLDKYPVQDKTRYRFMSYDNCDLLLKEDLSNTIIIIDESHRLVEKVRFSGPKYSHLYSKLQKSYKILSLTATPIYTDMFDLTYQVNLVAGQELLPFNEEAFQKQLFETKRWQAYWRGHLLESHLFPRVIFTQGLSLSGLPFFLAMQCGNIATSSLQILLALFNPLEHYPLKDLKYEAIKPIINTYFSHYEVDSITSEYPKSFLSLQTLDYNTAQLKFLYRFYDSQFKLSELTQFLKDSDYRLVEGEDYIRLNNSALQSRYKNTLGAGREVGNLTFYKPHSAHLAKTQQAKTKNFSETTNCKKIFPPKFEQILHTIQQSHGPVVVYSHYYYNGLLLFKQFLEDKGYQGQYRIFHPEMSKEQQAQITQAFNKGKIKILLLHPEITEGISLKGTQQMHFLEVPINRALQQQVSARAIRYQSHNHLPLYRRKVNIYIWLHKNHWLDWRIYAFHRHNWQENFPEVSYYSPSSVFLDKNATLKNIGPDLRAYIHLNMLNSKTETFRGYLKQCSIESAYDSQTL